MAGICSTVSVKQNRKRYGLLFAVTKAMSFNLKLACFGIRRRVSINCDEQPAVSVNLVITGT
jgi:hypothetical protein